MGIPKESDGKYEEADLIKHPGVRVCWMYARRKDELNSLAVEFGIKADGTDEEARKAFANLVSAGSFPQRVWNRLAQLQEQYSSPCRDGRRDGTICGVPPNPRRL